MAAAPRLVGQGDVAESRQVPGGRTARSVPRLEGQGSVEGELARQVDRAHAPAAQFADDLVVAESLGRLLLVRGLSPFTLGRQGACRGHHREFDHTPTRNSGCLRRHRFPRRSDGLPRERGYRVRSRHALPGQPERGCLGRGGSRRLVEAGRRPCRGNALDLGCLARGSGPTCKDRASSSAMTRRKGLPQRVQRGVYRPGLTFFTPLLWPQ